MLTGNKRPIQVALAVLFFFAFGFALAHATAAQEPGELQRSTTTGVLFLPLITGNTRGATSFALIEQALARGEINEETALVYKVFAVYLDPRLPARFQGDDSQVRDTLIAGEVSARWNTLSPETQALLAPFLLPPAVPGSWVALQAEASAAAARPEAPVEWRNLSRPGGRVKVWYQTRYSGDEGRAAQILADTEDIVWPALTGLMGRAPLSDAGLPNNGGDSLFDIYLVRIRAHGEAHAYPPACEQRPSYLLVDGAKPNLRETVAHEFFHAITWSYNVSVDCVHPGEYQWLNEASATWAEDYVSPQANTEQEYALYFLLAGDWPLETVSGLRQYGAYLWPFFLAHTSQPGIVRTIWEATQSKNSLAAIDGAITGGFLMQWPAFARLNVNDEPVNEYEQWDGLTIGTPYAGRHSVVLIGAEKRYTLPAELPHLSAKYYRFSFDDPAVSTVRYLNAYRFFHGAEPRAKVQALVRMEGQGWTTEDWTTLTEREFCRTEPAERVEELVLIFSNSEWQNRSHVLNPGTEPRLIASDAPCSCEQYSSVENWTGQVAFSFTASGSEGDASISYNHSATVNLEMGPGYESSNYVAWQDVSLGGTGQVEDNYNRGWDVRTAVGSGALSPAGPTQDDPSATLGVDLSTCTFEFHLQTSMPALYTSYGSTVTTRTGVGFMDINDIPAGELSGSRQVPAVSYPFDEPSWYVPGGVMDYELQQIVGSPYGEATVSWSFSPAD